jgi:flagellar basal body-associated protein FliL
MNTNSSRKGKYLLPIGLAILGIAAAVAITVVLLKQQESEEQESERDVENYDMKNVPVL